MVSSCCRRTFFFVLQVYFPQFVTSDLYFKYLGELINTVQTQDLPGIRRKRTGQSPYFRLAQLKLIQTRILMVSECKLEIADKHAPIIPYSDALWTLMMRLTLIKGMGVWTVVPMLVETKGSFILELKRIFLWSLPIFNVNIKLDSLRTHQKRRRFRFHTNLKES